MMDGNPGDPLSDNYVDNDVQKGPLGGKAPHVENPNSGFTKETPAAEFGPDYDTGA